MERVVGKSQEPGFLSLSLGRIRIPCKSWGPGFLIGGMKGLDKTTSKVPSNFTIGCLLTRSTVLPSTGQHVEADGIGTGWEEV